MGLILTSALSVTNLPPSSSIKHRALTALSGPFSQHLINPRSQHFCHLLHSVSELPLLSTPTAPTLPEPSPHHLSPGLLQQPPDYSELPLSPPHPPTCPALHLPAPRAIFPTHHFHRLLPCSNTFTGSLWPTDSSPLSLPSLLPLILSQTDQMISTRVPVPYLGL